MTEHVEDKVPPQNPQLDQFENALATARAHLLTIPRFNALAIRVQERIIKQWEARIAELKGQTWLT